MARMNAMRPADVCDSESGQGILEVEMSEGVGKGTYSIHSSYTYVFHLAMYFLPVNRSEKDIPLYILPATDFMIDSVSVLSLTESLSRSGKQYNKKDIVLFSSYESKLD
jgi:hypothetical protein